jgi:hypothetical protein
MQNSALSPKAVMLMSKIKRQLVVSGVKADVVDGLDWSYEEFDNLCKQFHAEKTYADLKELSEEVHKEVAANMWGL